MNPKQNLGGQAADIHAAAVERGMNFRSIDDSTIGLNLDETTSRADILSVLHAFGASDAEVRHHLLCWTPIVFSLSL